MKNFKTVDVIFFSFLALSIVGLVIYFFVIKKEDQPSSTTTIPKPGTTTGSAGPGTTTTNKSKFPLKRGSKGTEVKTLQVLLNNWLSNNLFFLEDKAPKDSAGKRIYTLTTDGDFGTNTEAVVLAKFGKKEVTESEFKNFK